MNNKLVNRLIAIICVTGLSYIFINYLVVRPLLLENNYRYTICSINKIKSSVNGGPDACFNYTINNKTYEGLYDLGGLHPEVKIGQKYLLKFYPPNPKNAKFLIDSPCDIGLEEVPTNGWKELP